MVMALVFYAMLMSEICLIMGNSIKLEVTISGASPVENGTEGIFGGIIAENHAYPWQVKLERDDRPLKHWCGGSIICPGYIMTAAHCVAPPVDVERHITVFAGINRKGDPGEQRRRVNRAIIHPNYIPSPVLLNDYAVLDLSTPINLRPETSPIYLPLPNEPGINILGTRFAASGWGKTEKTATPRDLRVETLFQYTPSECPVRDPSEFCTGRNVPRFGVCNGDSGGKKYQKSLNQNVKYFFYIIPIYLSTY